MDASEIFLLFVVSVTIVVFIILENLEKQSNLVHDFESKARTGSFLEKSVKAVDDQDEKDSVGTFGEAGNPEKGCEEIVGEKDETEDQVRKRGEISEIYGGGLGISGNIGIIGEDCGNKDELFEDWEGVERTELEKLFGEAVVFVNSKNSNADHRIGGDLMLQLYGLQKVALEGPFHGSQPMALKFFARYKWNVLQKLGNMSREVAMEKYVEILSMAIPQWKMDRAFDGEVQDAGTYEVQTSTHNKDGVENQMLRETPHKNADPST